MIGETLGNYRIVSTIGEGGMGVVYGGEHVMIGRRVAVKLLQPKMSNDAELVERFFNEARAAAMIQHPGLVEVFDFGHTQDGRAYLVMELLDGESLAARLKRERRIAIDLALVITRQVASALHAAHEQGIVHRDLKPENVFLTADQEGTSQVRAKVLDFGVAKLARTDDARSVKTRTGAVFGTPRYMAPEQCKNATDVDRRSDVYALGCILYEMILGRPPFAYDNWGELIAAHIHETPPPPREVDPTLADELERILLRALAKRPADRFATMTELIDAIEAWWQATASGPFANRATPMPGMKLVSNPEDRSLDAQIAPTLPVAAELSLPSAPRGPSGRRRGIVIGAVAAAAIAAAVVLATRARPASDAQPSNTALASAVAAPPDAAAPAPVDAAPVKPVAVDAAIATRVRLVVESVPSGADVYRALDGVKLGKTPFARDFERIEGELELVLKRPGYHDAKIALSTATDGTVRTRLSRLVTTTKTSTRAGSASSEHRGSGATVLDPYGGP